MLYCNNGNVIVRGLQLVKLLEYKQQTTLPCVTTLVTCQRLLISSLRCASLYKKGKNIFNERFVMLRRTSCSSVLHRRQNNTTLASLMQSFLYSNGNEKQRQLIMLVKN